MSYTIIKPADRKGWLAQREKGIGSSEVGTILGVNPFDTPYQLWRRKKGMSPAIQENEAMRAGHILEGAVATFFEQETGRKVIKASEGDWLAVDNDRDFLRVSPDRTYWLDGKHSKDNKGIVEIKTTQLDIDAADLPKHWYVQLQYQLGVMGYRQGSLAWLTRGVKFGYQDIAFDADLYGYMVEKLEQFWTDCIKGDQEPAITTIDDVQAKFASSSSKTIEVSQEIMDDITTLKSLKPQIDNLTSQKKELEDRIKLYMQDADTLCLQGTKDSNPSVIATWKSAKDSEKFDEKRFASEHPDLYNQYMINVTGSRRFLVK
jgi:putative phage-type endonuclease